MRERGDVVAEARQAADHTQHQAAELLGGENVPGGPVHHRPVG
ncbi:hypothetical protein [Streptomyces humi]